MPKSKSDDLYPEKEAQQRFEAALRGARIAGHKPMSSIPRKRPKTQRKPRKNAMTSAS
jgi:hypothetical protein